MDSRGGSDRAETRAPHPIAEPPDLQTGAAAPEPRWTAGLDLSLELQEEGSGVAGEVVFATALFNPETVKRYTGYLRRMLEGVAADETRPVDRLALLSEEERPRVTEEWNRTEAPYPTESFIHDRFEAQAARTPGRVAVVYEDRELTYGELNERANQLAHHLRGLGVGPDVRVGICVEREPELVMAVLRVLKPGGAYVPLQPPKTPRRMAKSASRRCLRAGPVHSGARDHVRRRTRPTTAG